MMLFAALAQPIWWGLLAVLGVGVRVLWVRDKRAEAAHEARCEAIEAAPRQAREDTTELSILPVADMPRSHRVSAAKRHDAMRAWQERRWSR